MSARRLIGAALVTGVAMALGLVAALHPGAAPRRPRGSHTAPPRHRAPSAGASGASAGVARVETGFIDSYGRFLDGDPAGALAFASLTASAQARADGPIPAAFRDGPLRLASLTGRSGPYSATATVVLANREERYPFAIALLREARGWVISALDPPDLSMDRTLRPVRAVRPPAALAAAARRFVAAYARFRTGRGPLPTAAASALAAIRRHSDSLAGLELGHAAPRVAGLAFGPVDDGEVAVTATVTFGRAREQFSLLMQRQAPNGVWRCAAFL